MSQPLIFISAGEISGDLHGGRMLASLRRRFPSLTAFGIGGRELESAGLEKFADISQLSLVGITEVLPRLFSIYRLLSRTREELTRRRPRAVVLIDAPDFNLPLARHAHSLGIKVIYYISPTIWAWRRKRLEGIRKNVDLMLTILPFEEDLYRRNGVRSAYVGNPLVDQAGTAAPRASFLKSLGINEKADIVALLPGSRRSEVRRILPLLLEAASILGKRSSPPLFIFPAASGEIYDLLLPLVGKGLPGAIVVRGRAIDVLASSRAAVVTSGTATLEAALQSTPFLAVYRLSSISYLIGRMMVKTPWISLPNILLREGVVVELIQNQCRPERIAAETARLIDDDRAALRMKRYFAIMRETLGAGDAADRAAGAVAAEADLDDSFSPVDHQENSRQ
ncbi:lipid-A-disaccharide synthase [Candidatus Moduliflexota bacterium]